MTEASPQEFFASRWDQVFPRLTDEEIERLRRFGQPRPFNAGDLLVSVGQRGHGLILIISG